MEKKAWQKDWNFKIPKTPPKGYTWKRYELIIPEDVKWEFRDLAELEVYYAIETQYPVLKKGWIAEGQIKSRWIDVDDQWFFGIGNTKLEALKDLRAKIEDSKIEKKWKVVIQYTIDGQGTSKELTITAGTKEQASSKVWDARYDFDNFGIVSITEIKMGGGNINDFNYTIGGL